MPFAIIAAEPSGALGIGLASASPKLEDWVVVAEPGVGIAAFHALNAAIATATLGLLRDGLRPVEVLDHLSIDAAGTRWQALVLDPKGRATARSGPGCQPAFGHTIGTEHVAAGVALQSPNVIGAMSLSFERSAGDPFAERLLFALESGERAGSDQHGLRSASIQVLSPDQSRTVHVFVEDDVDPITRLRRIGVGRYS